jgi:alpha-tubulin suppressor-like RCC1 family protein
VDSDKPKQIYLRLNKNILAEEYFNDFGIKFLVKQLEGGGRFSLVLTTSGHLFSFGYGSGGQLGLGHSDNVA